MLAQTIPDGSGAAQSGGRELGFSRTRWKPGRRKSGRASPMTPGLDPLYLFAACGLSWRKQGNAGAGWELVACLKRSVRPHGSQPHLSRPRILSYPGSGPGALAGPGRPPRKVNGRTGCEQGGGNHEYPVWTGNYRDCLLLQVAQTSGFVALFLRGAEGFQRSRPLTHIRRSGSVEGQLRSVLILCSGKVKLSTTSRDGKKVLILKMAEAARYWA